MEEMENDVENVTTADFAVKLFLSKEFWNSWLECKQHIKDSKG
jgi:hypothetical protein